MVSRVMREMGRKGGKIGGKRSLETMTPEQRSERARKGGLAGGRGRPKKAAKVSAMVRSRKAQGRRKAKGEKP